MALLHLKIDQVFRILQISGMITCTWPNNPDAGKPVYIFREIGWIFAILNVIIVEMALVGAVYHYRDDVTTVMKALSQFTALIEVAFNLIICKWKRARMQHLLDEIKDFLRDYGDNRTVILQKYIDRYCNFALFVVTCHVSAIFIFSCGPLFLSTKLPAEGWYPFPVETLDVIIILYASQVCSIIHTGLGIGIDFIFSIYFFYASARLEMLWLKIKDAKTQWEINSCIKEHQEIIKFVNETRGTVKYGLLKTNITMASAAICGAFPIVRKQSFWVTSQFIFMLVAAAQRLYITAWPADDLMQNSELVAMETYNMPWIGKPQFFKRKVYFMIQRSQKPLVINMGSMLPNLSLEYYSRYLVTMFSYFTTMRTVLGD